ncbi:MAG: hypothetical protein J7L47_02645 [Candidatus Odinarchaeota archaeon]|nr:hypothetical protein [Candidatus Odinarchaeota archaeon]
MSEEKIRCPRCGSDNVFIVSRVPHMNKMEYTYKCEVCHHTWTVKK